MRKLTLETLRRKGACLRERQRIRALVGTSVMITEGWCAEHAIDFDWDWAAIHLLSRPALAEYDRVRGPALAEYDRVCAVAWDEYDRGCEPAWAKYGRVCGPAWDEYDRVCGPARAEYRRVCAVTWARLYIYDV